MSTSYGAYTGKALKIDLTTKEVVDFYISDEDRKLYLGGKILAAKIISDHIQSAIDPLSEENIIVISTGPLTNTGCPSTSRFNVSTISPLTNLLTSSNCGGSFGMALKRAGLDVLVICGKSEGLVQLDITDKGVDFVDATHLKNMLTGETQATIGGKSGKLVIGPAGEHLVRYACAISDERAAGRGGVGAVMGSKNLKAITANGTKMVEVKNKEKLDKVKKKWSKMLIDHPLTGEQLPKLGTAALLSNMQHKNLLATKNFSRGNYEGYKSISGEELAEKYLVKNKGCITCPIRCARIVEVEGKQVKGPEVEVMGLLGANILNDNLESIIKWNYELDELGMDTISTAGTIAFAMELNEKGLLKSDLEFGKTDNLSDVFQKIAFRKELGDELADGSKALMKKYGGEEFCMQVKGMELAAYEPRGAVGQALGYSVSNRGGCHLNAGYLVVIEGLGLTINPHSTKGKAQFAIMFQNLMEAVSAGGSCLFTTYAFFPPFLFRKPNSIITRIVTKVLPYTGPFIGIANKYPGLLKVNIPFMLPHPVAISAATGIKLTMGGLLKIGARGYNLERLINLKLGVKKEDDTLPDRSTKVCQIEGNEKTKVPQEKLRKQYYRARGWNELGEPSKKTKKYYGLSKI